MHMFNTVKFWINSARAVEEVDRALNALSMHNLQKNVLGQKLFKFSKLSICQIHVILILRQTPSCIC